MSHTTGTLLSGVRILELGGMLAAPFATQILASLGAEVIKVERETGDPFRSDPKHFLATNIGKKSVLFDLRSDEGKVAFEHLLGSSHALIHNLSHRAEASLAVDYESCQRINPELVHCAIRAFGPGPDALKSGTNPIVESLTGVLATGDPDIKPSRQPIPYYDQMAGALAANCVLAMLLNSKKKISRKIEVDLFETGLLQVASKLTEFQITGTLPSQSTILQTAPYDFFQTQDKQWVFIGVVNDGNWTKICEVLGVPDLAEDERFDTFDKRGKNRELVNQLVNNETQRLSKAELSSLMEQANIPCAPVQNYEQVLQDPQVTFPGKLIPVGYEGRTVHVPSFPVTGDFMNVNADAVPGLGEHNSEFIDNSELASSPSV